MHVYTDGSVQVNHGGTEMGQGLHTKVAQVVADELGVPLARVLVTSSDTSKVPNASATAASSGTDLNGKAAQAAATLFATTWLPSWQGWMIAARAPSSSSTAGSFHPGHRAHSRTW